MTLVAHDPRQPDARRAIDAPGRSPGPARPGATPVRSIPTLMSTTIGISTPRSVATSDARRTWNGSSAQMRTSARSCRRAAPFDLGPVGQLVGDEDGWDAALDHDLGLRDLGAGDADGTEFHLAAGDPRRLVTLGVRPPVLAARGDGARQSLDVRLEAVQVEQQRRRVEIATRHADRGHGARRCSRACRRHRQRLRWRSARRQHGRRRTSYIVYIPREVRTIIRDVRAGPMSSSSHLE